MKAVVDSDTCVGCGLCANICPEVYVMDGDKAVVQGIDIPAEQITAAKEAASSCPVEAIQIEN